MRRLLIPTFVLIVALGACSVSVSRPRRFEAIGADGAPVSPSYLAYSFRGSRLNPVHSASYQAAPLALARSDAAGRVQVARAIYLHKPFPIETHPSLVVELLYVPALHNATGRADSGGRTLVADASGDPELWLSTMRNLSSLINRLASTRPGETRLAVRDPDSAAAARELIDHMKSEYDAFLARYAGVARRAPEMPLHIRLSDVNEQQRWKEQMDADLAREPLWGPLVERLFESDLRSLRTLESRLR